MGTPVQLGVSVSGSSVSLSANASCGVGFPTQSNGEFGAAAAAVPSSLPEENAQTTHLCREAAVVLLPDPDVVDAVGGDELREAKGVEQRLHEARMAREAVATKQKILRTSARNAPR
eukprot:scaffold236_cov228-Pinguiococcus_pyrenoidosus.AAC.3